MPSTQIASPISREEAHTILALQLLIARAANTDSLSWWEDESLTLHAGYLLERLFPRSPALAARRLALRAALARHRAACASQGGALHLYRLDADGTDRLALRQESLLDIPVPEQPIATKEQLRSHLLDLLGEPQAYNVLRRANSHGFQIEVPPAPEGISPLLHRAKALAWAYLEGEPHDPVFPYCME